MKIIPKEEKAKWVELYKSGHTSVEIAKLRHVAKRTVLVHLQNEGVPLRKAGTPLIYSGDKKQRNRQGRYKNKYNITEAEYDAMVLSQGGVCAICGNGPSGRGTNNQRLHVDHNHKTKKVRQLLCGRCNTSIGLIKESSELVDLMISYLKAHE